jgi:hypothetical protein
MRSLIAASPLRQERAAPCLELPHACQFSASPNTNPPDTCHFLARHAEQMALASKRETYDLGAHPGATKKKHGARSTSRKGRPCGRPFLLPNRVKANQEEGRSRWVNSYGASVVRP